MSARRDNAARKNRREGNEGTILEELVYKTEPEDSQLIRFDGAQPVTFTVGTPYDTGRIAIPAIDTLVTAVITRVSAIILSNLTAQVQKVSVSDNAGGTWLVDLPLAAKQFLVLKLEGAEWNGIRWSIVTAGSVAGQIVGEQ